MPENFNIINNTTKKISVKTEVFLNYKNTILGKKYELNIVIVSPAKSRELNRTYRDKDYPTNILSFPLSKNEGEIFLEPNKVKKGAKEFEMDFDNFLKFLVIHGMLHLKGLDHGKKMEALEEKYCKKFKVCKTK